VPFLLGPAASYQASGRKALGEDEKIAINLPLIQKICYVRARTEWMMRKVSQD
jgi:hypothetical protein